MISIVLLVVLVALAGVSPVFAPIEPFVTFDPPAACPGAAVGVYLNEFQLTSSDDAIPVLSSDPGGLIGWYECQAPRVPSVCKFLISESASCGRYTVTVTLPVDGSGLGVSGIFDVAGPCCPAPAVGGCVQPVNSFAMLSPWLAIVGLVGCIGTVVVVAKRRRP